MSKSSGKIAFTFGVIFGIFILIGANYLSYLNNTNFTCDDCGWSFGFPLPFYQEGGFISFKEILWTGLIINILVGLIFSFVIGLIFSFAWSKITAKSLK
jgi:hypothetical protein